MSETGTAVAIEDGGPRCFHCGAVQADPEARRCAECNQHLRLAAPPVARGPAGWCAEHPDRPVTGVCSRCGTFTCTACDVSVRGVRLCRSCRDDLAVRLTAPVPFEERRAIGWLQGWWRTTAEITARPARFFDAMEPTRDLGSALLYGGIGATLTSSWQILFGLMYVAMGILVGGVGLFAPSGPPSSGPHPALIGLGFVSGMGMAVIVLAPLMTLLGYLLMACLQHGTLRLFGAGGELGLVATLKIGLYALGTGWCGLVPYVGQWLHPFWWTGLMVVGISKVHGCSPTRALSVLIPVGIVCIAPVVAYVAFFFVMILVEVLG